MKKNTTLLISAIICLTLSGCNSQPPAGVDQANGGLVKTGRTVDLTELAGKTVTTTPGDVLHLKLANGNDGQRQWYVGGNEAMGYLTLDKHQADEWWLLVEKTGNFAIIFIYGLPGKTAEKTFKVDVISQL